MLSAYLQVIAETRLFSVFLFGYVFFLRKGHLIVNSLKNNIQILFLSLPVNEIPKDIGLVGNYVN